MTRFVLTMSVLAAGVVAAASLGIACDPGASAGSDASKQGERGGDCVTCHLAEYEHARDHVDVKPTTCGVCHGQDGWRPSVLHHEWWALTGGHTKAPCAYCHGHKGSPDVFKGTPKDCVTCHRPEYDASTFPGHETFSTKCADCHTTTAWRPATHTPPPAVVPATITPPLGTRGAATPPKATGSPKTPATTRPVVVVKPPPTTPPRVPTVPTTPPPDMTSRSSPLRR